MKKSAVRKVVIPVAGLGTRFLPATKSVPKELLPLVDKPILMFVFEEALRAGIEEVILIQGRGKSAIEDFFDISHELEANLEKAGKLDLLEGLNALRAKMKVISIRQHEALGLGHAVLCAKPAVGDEPFAVMLGDEIMLSVPGADSGIGQLCELYEKTGLSSVAVMEVKDADVSKYGIVAVEEKKNDVWKVTSVVEKPSLATAPSRLALPGRYVFDASIFQALEKTKPGKNGEIQLTDAMTDVAKGKGLLATQVKARRFDAGDKLGFLQANVEIALEHPQLGKQFKDYLKTLVGNLK
jgi:UTP--glucose-1-phosphate uridylyltransferase